MNSTETRSGSKFALWLPLAVFGLFVGLVYWGLAKPADRQVHSAMVGKPMPQFVLRPALPGTAGLAREDLADGKPRLINIFASWCVPCAVEAPQLAAIRHAGVDVVGVAIRDKPDELQAFLKRNGNPFSRIGADDVSAIQFALGSSGVPESFVVDGQGIIRYQHIGDIRPDQVAEIVDRVREAGR